MSDRRLDELGVRGVRVSTFDSLGLEEDLVSRMELGDFDMSIIDEESARFGLRFTCEDCAIFDERADRCRHEWPTDAHRRARYEAPRGDGDEVVFCKEFEAR